MKCDMDDKGKITVEPVDQVECFALKAWADKTNLVTWKSKPKYHKVQWDLVGINKIAFTQ